MNYSDLEKLHELREKKVITEEEFENEKRKILSGQSPSSSSAFGKDLFGLEQNKYCMLMHLSQFFGFVVPYLGLFAALALWLVNRENPTIDRHGKNIANAQISYHIYAFVSAVLILLLVGLFALIVLGVIYFVSVIIAGFKASDGVEWEYPLTIRFFK